MASRSAAHWAALPPDLLQHVFSLLANDERLPVLDVCSSWYAALLAAPALVPTVVLNGIDWSHGIGYYIDEDEWRVGIAEVYDEDSEDANALLQAAANLPDHLPAIKLQGFNEQPELIPAVLAVLPEGLFKIELATHCTGPVLASLARFKRCRALSISGNGAFVSWHGRGAASVVPKLRQLRLDCRQPTHCPAAPTIGDSGYREPEPDDPQSCLDSRIPAALAAATALRSLALVLDWTSDVATLCLGLPALRSLLLEVNRVREGHMESAVGMLQALPGLTCIKLGFSAWPKWHGRQAHWEGEYLQVPPLGVLTKQLFDLRLNAVCLPRDWRSHCNLRRLSWDNITHQEGDGVEELDLYPTGWRRDPLSALTALTKLDLHQDFGLDVELVASLPRLATLHVPYDNPEWETQLHMLRPDLYLTG